MTFPNNSYNFQPRPIYTLPTQNYDDINRNADAYGNRDGITSQAEIQQFGNILGYYAQAYGQAYTQTKAPVYKQVADMLTRDWYVSGVITQNFNRFSNASNTHPNTIGITRQDIYQFAARDRDVNTISTADLTTTTPYTATVTPPPDFNMDDTPEN